MARPTRSKDKQQLELTMTVGGFQRRVRPSSLPKVISGPHAGFMKNPPENCKYKTKDPKNEVWVDVYFCGIKCELKERCSCAELLRKGRTERIKNLNQ